MRRINLNNLMLSYYLKYRLRDFRHVTDDPLEALENASGRYFLINIPLAKWRHPVPLGCGCTAIDQNPLIETARAYGNGTCVNYSSSPLRRYYEDWQPRSMGEALGVDVQNSSAPLSQMTAHTIVMPWHGIRLSKLPTRAARRLQSGRVRDAKKRLKIDDPVEGIICWGPVSKTFGDIAFDRLARLYDSIRAQGFTVKNFRDPMKTYVLVRDNEFCVMPRSGKHRVAVMSALDYQSIPVLMGPSPQVMLVRREEVAAWPHVVSGLFTPSDALAVFDRIIEARPPRPLKTR